MDQDQNTQDVKPTPMPDSSPFPKAASDENKSSLMLVAACVVVLVLVFIGWFMMKQTRMEEEVVPIMETTAPEVTAQHAAPTDATVAALETQGTSDEITAIEADITSTDFSSFDDTNNI